MVNFVRKVERMYGYIPVVYIISTWNMYTVTTPVDVQLLDGRIPCSKVSVAVQDSKCQKKLRSLFHLRAEHRSVDTRAATNEHSLASGALSGETERNNAPPGVASRR